VFDDRRRASQPSGDRDTFIAASRRMAASAMHVSRTLLETMGERIALERVHPTAASPAAGLAGLILTEVDVEGRFVTIIAFDLDDRRAAAAEMIDRTAGSEVGRWLPAAAFDLIRAMNDHDLDRCRAALHDAFVFDDHRRTGVGRIERADDYVASLAPMFERAPDVTFETLYSIATNEHGNLAMGHMFGTLADGGAVESFYVRLTLFQSDRMVGTELFEPEDLDLARARFAALSVLRP